MEDFEAALSNPEVSALKLSGDISSSKVLNVNRELELDLNGHTFSADMNSALFNVGEGGKLTLKGGTASNKGQVGTVSNGGEIIIADGNYTSSKAAAFRATVRGNITVNGGTLTGQEGAIDCRGKGSDNLGANAVTINGGVLTGVDNFAVATNGSTGMGGNVITLNDGELEGNIKSAGYEAIGVYIANSDTFVMNGGTIKANGGTGICMRAGHVTINGGSVIATGTDKDGNPVADGKVGDNSTVLTGVSAIVFHESANYPGNADHDMSLEIKGGTITGIDKSIDVLVGEGVTPNITVTGGTLTPAYPAA